MESKFRRGDLITSMPSGAGWLMYAEPDVQTFSEQLPWNEDMTGVVIEKFAHVSGYRFFKIITSTGHIGWVLQGMIQKSEGGST